MTDTDPSAGFNTFTCWLSVKISLPPKEGTQLGCRASTTCEMVRPSRFTLYKPCSTCAGSTVFSILGDPGAASRDDGIFVGESLQQERESPWALTLTERVPEAFEIPPSDWPEKYFSGQSEVFIAFPSFWRLIWAIFCLTVDASCHVLERTSSL